MKIAVDVTPLANPLTGIGQYTIQLLNHLCQNRQHDWFLYSCRKVSTELPQGPNVHFREISTPIPSVVMSQLCFPLWCWQDKIERFWAPGQHLTRFLPSSVKKFVTIHDLVWIVAPETVDRKSYWIHKLLTEPAIRKANVISVSSKTTEELKTHFNDVAPATILLSPRELPDLSPSDSQVKALLETEFLLFVGTNEPRKNLPALLEAFDQVKRDSLKLVIVGAGQKGDHNQTGNVEYLGFVADADLAHLYSNARLVVLPSFYEGFGLPGLEALANGTPVVTTPDTEISRLESTLVFTSLDASAGAIAEALDRALEADTTNAEKIEFSSWRQTSEQILEVIC